jgi:ABC-type phosphate transport system substrate-binding protein
VLPLGCVKQYKRSDHVLQKRAVSLLKETKIDESEILLVVPSSNAIKSLASAQTIRVLGGKVKNWKEVCGSNLPIELQCPM